MKKSNKHILIYSSTLKAMAHLDEVDTHPGNSQRNLDAAYERLVDIKTISQMVVDESIDEKMTVYRPKKARQYRSNQGRSPEKMEKIYKGCFWVTLVGLFLIAAAGIYNIVTL
jgi:hypothetical protein